LNFFLESCDTHSKVDITKYVAILLFSTCLSGNIRNWYRYLPEKIIKSWESFKNAFTKRWDGKKNTRIFTTKFHEVNKEDSKYVRSFNKRFNDFINFIPKYLILKDVVILFKYFYALKGQFTFPIRDKDHDSVTQAKDCSIKLEENIMIEPYIAMETINIIDLIDNFVMSENQKLERVTFEIL
jgi:hypothetical protein